MVAPYLVVVATDARYYADLSSNVFRFLPVRLTSTDLARMHGANERIGIREYEAAIRTYRQLLKDVAAHSQATSGPGTYSSGIRARRTCRRTRRRAS